MAKMATLRLFDDLYTHGFPSLTSLLMISGNAKRCVYVDVNSFDRIIVEGRNLDYELGRPMDGTLTKVTLADENGNPLQVLSDFKLDAGQLAGATAFDFAANLLARLQVNGLKAIGTNQDDSMSASIGRDRLMGRGGEDTLDGGGGRDVLIGGADNDTFVFTAGHGKDTITDFDADGGIGFQDRIGRAFADVDSTTQVGQNTVIDFGDGDTVTLIGINAAQISSTDFTS